MRAPQRTLLLVAIVVEVMAIQAAQPIKLVRQPFANGEAIKLNTQAQDQMMKGDLAGAERTIALALQADPNLWLTYDTRARVLMREHKYELAIQDCNRVLLKYPKFIEAALLRAQANAHLGRYGESLKEFDYLIRIRPHLDSYARALNSRAWFLATCPDVAFRNGRQAVQDATLACKLTNWNDEIAIDSLAAAYAEAGDFDPATRYAEQALMVKGISSDSSKMIQRHLTSFKQHKPIRSS